MLGPATPDQIGAIQHLAPSPTTKSGQNFALKPTNGLNSLDEENSFVLSFTHNVMQPATSEARATYSKFLNKISIPD